MATHALHVDAPVTVHVTLCRHEAPSGSRASGSRDLAGRSQVWPSCRKAVSHLPLVNLAITLKENNPHYSVVISYPLGATGMVGQGVLREWLRDDR